MNQNKMIVKTVLNKRFETNKLYKKFLGTCKFKSSETLKFHSIRKRGISRSK